MTKKAILIHGWEGYPEEGWLPWLKNELEKQGFEVIVPAMPNSGKPKMKEWLDYLKKIVGNPDKNCYFVGHSLGCITILRYLESLKNGQNIGGAVLVAGFSSNLGYDELDSFFQNKINWDKIKLHGQKFIDIVSDNDPFVSLHYADFFKEKLGAEVIIEKNKGHLGGEHNINKLPSALKSVLKISSSSR
ncbi:esterase [Candidatus Falkowbacteria bacterium CG11_big_fil_rev_8_21_14_0_20_39_10]|uniref:Esterase n=1 Tax=Candidatus Falkowbacteria bacterium CG11_big_fil_rev_8_21_14_0_20_39_10 TaxID=1974570 RepID=A0A2M6K9U2_9BACT|nr:MAG: esterase [Candidatus Falkowbacteria bacterium CG11_big_fil_rev_8_21_14_0_20_39_10]